MVGGGGKEEEEREGPVLALPAAALSAVVSRLDAAVSRKARSCLPRALPSAWWSYRISVFLPPPREDKDMVEEAEGRMFPRPQLVGVTPSPEVDQRRARRCLHCDAAGTPPWMSGTTEPSTLCNACGVTRALREHRPPASPGTNLVPEHPISEPEVPGDIYLVRRSTKQKRTPRTEAVLVPCSRTTCLHCGSPEPPKLNKGPMGIREVCNSCGMRYKKGRFLPEFDPAVSQLPDLSLETSTDNSPPESPMWKPEARPAVYLSRKPLKQREKHPKMQAASVPGRRTKNRTCLHCGSSETPQWRGGPMGRGTLCNACGMRYKQGRLLPECRPVASQIPHWPPETPTDNSSPKSPVSKPEAHPAVYMARKPFKQRGGHPKMRASSAPGRRMTKNRSCLHCGSTETPQWREGPMGRGTLCNACGMRYKQGGLLPECHQVTSQLPDWPPETPTNNSPPESPIWKSEVRPAVYLSRKRAKQRGRHPKMKAAPLPGRKTKTKSCLHCGSSETPQWREGPMGRGTLCNACGMRYKQGRLLPEYRPMTSPTFVPSEHANSHRRVLDLLQKRESKDQHPTLSLSSTFMLSKHPNNHHHVPKLPQKRKFKDQLLRTPLMVDDLINSAVTSEGHPIDTPCCPNDHPVDAPGGANFLIDAPGGANFLVDAPGGANVLVDTPSSHDSLLLDGPSAPLIVESAEFVIS